MIALSGSSKRRPQPSTPAAGLASARPTFGAPRVLAEELGELEGLAEVHIVGSWAAAWHGHAQRVADLDVLAIGESSIVVRSSTRLIGPSGASASPLASW